MFKDIIIIIKKGNYGQRSYYNNYNQKNRSFRQRRFMNFRGEYNRMNNNNFRREDEDYRGFKGGNRNY